MILLMLKIKIQVGKKLHFHFGTLWHFDVDVYTSKLPSFSSRLEIHPPNEKSYYSILLRLYLLFLSHFPSTNHHFRRVSNSMNHNIFNRLPNNCVALYHMSHFWSMCHILLYQLEYVTRTVKNMFEELFPSRLTELRTR